MDTGQPSPPPPKPLVWLHGEIKSPPFSDEARHEAGFLLWRLQRGDLLSMPHSRPMPSVGPRCHELRVGDENVTWRIFYRLDDDAVVVAAVVPKKSNKGIKTPKEVIAAVKARLRTYDAT